MATATKDKPLSMAEKATLSYQADNYLAGLRRERVGYEKRVENAIDDDDQAAAKKYTKRIAQVDAEIERLERGGEVTPTSTPVVVDLGVDDEEPASKTQRGAAAKA